MARIKGQPLSIRLSESTDLFVRDEARRTLRSPSAIVEALTEEASRARRFPGIGFRGDDARRRAWVLGTGLDVWQIAEALDAAGSPEELVQQTELTERVVRLAFAYRERYPDEIEAAVAQNQRPLDELRSLYPFIPVVEAE